MLVRASLTLFPYTTLFRSRHVVHGNQLNPSRPHSVVRSDDGSPQLERLPHGERVTVILSGPQEHGCLGYRLRSEEHTSELSHVEISYAVFCLKKKKK